MSWTRWALFRMPALRYGVNAYHSKCKGWIQRFHGVATRCLDHYPGWHRMLDALGKAISPRHVLAAAFVQPYPHSTVP